ncbi:transposase [Lachnospiraceae bacterium MD308]|nr:transposase [Lachnospiraceae bacterium MD308]
MMHHVQAFDRDQFMMTTWDSMVDPESTARLIDAFVDSLDLSDYGVKELASEGRPPYDPKGLLKLYVYGSDNGIKSSRKLAKSCRVNVEVKWMLGGVEPDFRTIADFRKDNIDSLKKIFNEFNKRLTGAVEWGFTSIDGSKFAACNSKNNNFTKNKLDDRIKWLNGHIEEYLRILDDTDRQEDFEDNPEWLTREVIEEKLQEARERLKKYEGYQKIMEENGQSQMSLTDADAKLMKSKNGFVVAYNPQTAVDSETHLIRDFQMTNQVTDHGLLDSTLEGVREESEGIIETVADKGYESEKDMVKSLEDGIIPHVITDDGKDGYELEIWYEEADDINAESTDAEDLKKALHAGVIPEAYEDVITDIEVKEVRRKVSEEEAKVSVESIYGTSEEMMERAKGGYFVRDPERNLVYCPNGEILRQKCIKKNGNIRYANKNACRHCPNRNKCYKGKNEWKEIDFTKDCLEKPCKDWLKTEGKKPDIGGANKGKYHFETKKVVRFFLKPDRKKTAERMCLSEHPFGTIKRAMGFSYFLLRGLKKVTGEFALMCLGYNIKRAKKLLGFEKMLELMEVGIC